MRQRKLCACALSAFVLTALSGELTNAVAQNAGWKIDPAASQVVIHVGKSGLFSAAGHTHEITAPAVAGAIRFDPQRIQDAEVELTFDARALKVSPKGEPPDDVPKVQETMMSDRVLDVAKHPRITFRSGRISVERGSGSDLRLRVAGTLTLRGVSRTVGGPVDVKVAGDRLTGSGTLIVKQTQFGIEPVSAGLGTVKVKDDVTVTYTFVAGR